jgi:2-iminobutanoate/2-iminopropanoate deaminase
MQNRPFNPETIAAPLGPYAHGVEVDPRSRLTFISGQVGMGPDGVVPRDFRSQAELAWTNCLRILEHNGLRMKDVIKTTHYLTRREDIPAYNEIRAKFLGEERPCSTLLLVAGLAREELLVEIEMVAARPQR